jgi:hypothetical protein
MFETAQIASFRVSHARCIRGGIVNNSLDNPASRKQQSDLLRRAGCNVGGYEPAGFLADTSLAERLQMWENTRINHKLSLKDATRNKGSEATRTTGVSNFVSLFFKNSTTFLTATPLSRTSWIRSSSPSVRYERSIRTKRRNKVIVSRRRH